jgi:uncharacterized protein YggL (DUF469 family)
MPAPKRQQGQSRSKHDEDIDNYIDSLEAALRDCLEIAGSDCEHELCKAIIERISHTGVRFED